MSWRCLWAGLLGLNLVVWLASADAQGGQTAAQVAQAEMALLAIGYTIDAPDGELDPQSEHALARFLGRLELPAVDESLIVRQWEAASSGRTMRLREAQIRREAEERLVRGYFFEQVPQTTITRVSPLASTDQD